MDILTIANATWFSLGAFELVNIYASLGIALGLGLVIFFHELGHFAVAKWCNVNVERFSIGFGPIIWSRQRGETEYALSAIPFGGYVKMLGQDDMDPGQMTNEDVALDERSYSAKSVPQRMAIISAGVIMNIVTGLLFFAIAFRLGVFMSPARVGIVLTDSPAYVAGVEPGDTITHINGKEVHSFMDVTIGVTLSSGNIQLEGVHKSGDSFDLNVVPNYMNGTRRTIGVGPEWGMTFRTPKEPNMPATAPGSAASRASEPFEHGDKIVSVGLVDKPPEQVAEFAELAEFLSRNRDRKVVVGVERPVDDTKTVKKITVDPGNFRSLGVWMDIGLVTSIRNGSPAELAGFKKSDKIVLVDNKKVGIDIDPLRLPDYFAEQHGKEIEVEVRRSESGGGDTTATLKVTPADRPGWTTRPHRPTEPLTVPAIGLAFPVIPRIVKVDENSQAWKAGIRENQTVTKIELISEEKPENGYFKDLFAKPSEEIVLTPDDDKSVTPINWGYAFWMLQLAPTRWVKITVADGDETEVYDLHKSEIETVADWYLPTRGLRLDMANELQQGESFGEAFTMGLDYTKNTAAQIYLTLRSLVMRELSPKELHGPIGIFQVGYQVAEQGISKLLLFLGFLSINLAVLNFLPIPVLDGGHMVFLIWEGITRRKPSEKVMIAATYLGMAFVLSLMMFVLYLDIFVHSQGG